MVEAESERSRIADSTVPTCQRLRPMGRMAGPWARCGARRLLALPAATGCRRSLSTAAAAAAPNWIVRPQLNVRAIADRPGEVADNARRRRCPEHVTASVPLIASLHEEAAALRSEVRACSFAAAAGACGLCTE
eukprot:SAG22_NODE_1166_length_5291_cov_4.322227_5_plen_134_part_00